MNAAGAPKSFRILVISNAADEDQSDVADPLVQILERYRSHEKESWMHPATEISFEKIMHRGEFVPSKKADINIDKEKKSKYVLITAPPPVEVVCIHYSALRIERKKPNDTGASTGASSYKAPCMDDSVVFTYPVHYGSQLKIDEGRTHTERINDFHAVVVSGEGEGEGEGEAGWAEGFAAAKASKDANRVAEERQRKELESLGDYNPKLYVRPRSPSPDFDRKSDRDRPRSAVASRSAAGGGDPLDTLSPLYEWMLGTEVPVFGISLAHHLQATLRHRPLIRNRLQAERGNVEIVVVKDDPIFRGLGTQVALTSFDKTTWTAGGRVVAPRESSSLGCTLLVRQNHDNAIELPPHFELLASSRTCPCQMMRDRTKKIFYTVQFMPEYHNARLLYNFLYLVEHPPSISARDQEIKEEEERAIVAARIREEEEAKAAAAAAEANAKAKRAAWKASLSPQPEPQQDDAEDEARGKEGKGQGLFVTDATALTK